MKTIEILPDTLQVPYPYSASPSSFGNSFLSNRSAKSDETVEVPPGVLFYELCEATRAGQLDRVRYLVEVEKVPLNLRDVWDSSPLYYACLCGHLNLIKYFLENGARCEPNTFEAERCLYGALSDEIRNYLKCYNFSKAVDSQQPFASFLYKLYQDRTPVDSSSLILFKIFEGGKIYEIYAHRWLMAARSPVFRHFFLRRWKNTDVVEVRNRMFKVSCFKLVIMWMYTGRIELNLVGATNYNNLAAHLLENLLLMCRIWKLETLDFTLKSSLGLNYQNMQNLERMGGHVGIEKIQEDFSKLIKIIDGQRTLLTVMSMANSVLADVVIKIDSQYFPAHKDILVGQSEYFSALFGGNFCEVGEIPFAGEKSNLKMLRVVELETEDFLTWNIFHFMMEYMYTDHVSIPTDKVSVPFKLLHASDLFLLDKLKSLTVVVLCGMLGTLSRGVTKSYIFGEELNSPAIQMDVSIFELTRVAMDLELDRLEKQCIQFIAFHFDELSKSEEFKQLIRSSAETIHERQEQDSIPFVDDLRWYLIHLNDDELLDKKSAMSPKVLSSHKEKHYKKDDTSNIFVGELESLRRINELDDILESLNLKVANLND